MKILIADDHELIGNGIAAYYSSNITGTEVSIARNKSELIFQLNSSAFDVLIQDLQFGKDDAREIYNEIKRLQPDLPILILSSHTDTFSVKSAMAVGFNGYVSKAAPVSEIPTAVDAVLRGEKYLSSDIREKLSLAMINGKGSDNIELSSRELEVLLAIQNELSTKEIAGQLHLSEKTVEAYRSNLFLKFDVKNVAGLVKKAILHGYIAGSDQGKP